jgi:flagellar motility protein MotE (MotC chaperone)
MEYVDLETLRERHAAWRLLRAGNAALVLAFLGDYFVQGNRGACPASELATALDDRLYALNAVLSADGDAPRFPKEPRAYLEDWAASEAGYLRRFYPPGDDEVHYEVTSAFEKAYAWVGSLQGRAFVGTESRLHTVLDLLRQIVHGTQEDPELRLAELRRRRAEIDAEIAAVEAGEVAMLDATGVRDRYQQLSTTARELLSDFREVEDNFRLLDRAARERIATWEGSKGDLLQDLVGSRSDITGSDQGRSFQAFYDFLLSQSRQEELSELLAGLAGIDALAADDRIRSIHHDWSEAADRAQRTIRQISEQLRRFLDDQVWVENRRVLDLVRAVEAAALQVRANPPPFGLTVNEPGIDIVLPFERPLYTPPVAVAVDSAVAVGEEEDVDADLLFVSAFIDQARLLDNIRTVVPRGSEALLEDLVLLYPIEHGAAEIVGYLALPQEDVSVEIDDSAESSVEYPHPSDPDAVHRARMPKVTVRRR